MVFDITTSLAVPRAPVQLPVTHMPVLRSVGFSGTFWSIAPVPAELFNLTSFFEKAGFIFSDGNSGYSFKLGR